MTKRKTETQPAKPRDYLLAEALLMARRARVISNLPYRVEEYYECQLCAGKSADLQSEIRHESYCPLERLK